MAWQYLQQVNQGEQNRDVIIGTPNTGTVSYEWALKFRHLNMIPGLSWGTVGYSGQPVDIARNIICTNALRLNARYLFFLDSDVLVYPDTLINLHKKQLPLISGTYINRGPPYNIVANIGKRGIPGDTLRGQIPPDPIVVDECGAGCLLIDIRVLHRLMDMKIVDNWFCLIDHDPGNPDPNRKEVEVFTSKEAKSTTFLCPKCQQKLNQTNILLGDFFTYNIMRDKQTFEGEDYNFCKKVKKTGIQIRVDLNNVVRHEVARLIVDKEGIHNANTMLNDTLKAIQ